MDFNLTDIQQDFLKLAHDSAKEISTDRYGTRPQRYL